jgi:hypothetical protein
VRCHSDANDVFLCNTHSQGDDEIIVLSTNPSTFLFIYGGLGSDTFIITPRTVDPVISKNLRGHRGIIEHSVVAENDSEYNGLVVRGVQVRPLPLMLWFTFN